jgi:UDP-N-acetylmuramoylalanine--D-glutamate ligase
VVRELLSASGPGSDARHGPLAGIQRVLVVGLGRSGLPAAEALRDAGVHLVLTDASETVDVPADLREVADVHLGADGERAASLVADVDLVVPSPGVPEHAPVIRRALTRGVPVWSEPELGWRLAPRRLLAVTGTNGKTTTTELLASMLHGAGRDVVACGNIGNPFTAAAVRSETGAVLVAELSSFQLRFAHRLRPRVGVLLNLAPDHLDWHGDLGSYAAAKARLWQAQHEDDRAVSNLDDEPAARLAREHAAGRVVWISTRRVPDVGVGVADGSLVARLPEHDGALVDLTDLPVAASHHVSNVAAAACAALLDGAPPEAVSDAARQHRPGAHRLELVGERDGVRYVDDSKATNPHAALAALRAEGSDRPVVWVAGGLAKEIDLSPLRGGLDAVRHAVLLGSAAERLADIASESDVPFTHVESMEEAVARAAGLARSGDVVLLAPACASFDQFQDYADRGERFAAAVRRLMEG